MNSLSNRKHRKQNARAFKHASRHVQELCNSLSDTSWRQSPGNAIYKRILVEVNFLFTIWWQLIDK